MSSIRGYFHSLLIFAAVIIAASNDSLGTEDGRKKLLAEAENAERFTNLNTLQRGRIHGELLKHFVAAVTTKVEDQTHHEKMRIRYGELFKGIEFLQRATHGTEVKKSEVVFVGRETQQIKDDCKQEVSKVLQLANVESTSGYRKFLETTFLRMLFDNELPATELPELFVRYFITLSALTITKVDDVKEVKDHLKQYLDCYVKQLLAMLKEPVPQGSSQAGIVADQIIEVINAISYDATHWKNPIFWY